MRFSKQIKSLDRRFFVLRKKFSWCNRLYNHLSGVNVEHSFHSKKRQSEIKQQAREAIDALLAPTQKPAGDQTKVPKIIWAYWHSGFASAPEVVQLGINSWQQMNPDYEVRLLDNNNLHEYLGVDFAKVFQLSSIRCLLPTKADILRFYLLSRYGGVWIDATTFCLEPLNEWLPQAMEPCHLFNFKQKNNPTRPIEAWFIASPQGSPIINDVLQQYIEYLTKPRALTLYITGKVILLENILTEEEKQSPLTPDVSYRAEKEGFMPYFSVAYFYYAAIKRHLTPEQVAMYLRQDDGHAMTNEYALTKDPYDAIATAKVSKQTYLLSYSRSELFKKRKQVLAEKLAAIKER